MIIINLEKEKNIETDLRTYKKKVKKMLEKRLFS